MTGTIFPGKGSQRAARAAAAAAVAMGLATPALAEGSDLGFKEVYRSTDMTGHETTIRSSSAQPTDMHQPPSLRGQNRDDFIVPGGFDSGLSTTAFASAVVAPKTTVPFFLGKDTIMFMGATAEEASIGIAAAVPLSADVKFVAGASFAQRIETNRSFMGGHTLDISQGPRMHFGFAVGTLREDIPSAQLTFGGYVGQAQYQPQLWTNDNRTYFQTGASQGEQINVGANVRLNIRF